MKSLTTVTAALLIVLISVANATAGSFEFDGAELKEVHLKAIKKIFTNGGIDLNTADVLIEVKKSEQLTKTMGMEVVFVETTILIGNQTLEGRCGFPKKHLFEATKRSVREAVEKHQ